jgi:hypothetical protein
LSGAAPLLGPQGICRQWQRQSWEWLG